VAVKSSRPGTCVEMTSPGVNYIELAMLYEATNPDHMEASHENRMTEP
jgi:hypothetical protein